MSLRSQKATINNNKLYTIILSCPHWYSSILIMRHKHIMIAFYTIRRCPHALIGYERSTQNNRTLLY